MEDYRWFNIKKISGMEKVYPDFKHDSFAGLIGISQVDITPPVGIYFRNWGAGFQGAARGVHLPLKLTCISFKNKEKEKPLLLISADFGVWVNGEEGQKFRTAIADAMNLSSADLMFSLTHTHSGPILSKDESDKPGGQLIDSYLNDLQQSAVQAARKSITSAVPAVLTWHYGKCSLAANRDLPDNENNRFIVGYNPNEPADDTVLVGRVTDEQDRVMGTIVNYACHPTTLAWDNHLISPDYIGAMRDLVESNTKAPCLFLQGASGDLAPAEQYTDVVELADQYGRALGYSVLSILESMMPPKTALAFDEVIESGAPLAIWKKISCQPSQKIKTEQVDILYQLKSLPSLAEIDDLIAQCTTDRVMRERLARQRNIRITLGEGKTIKTQLWIWKLGDAFLLGQPNEAYSVFQKEVRNRFFPRAMVVMNLVNGSAGYLPPFELYQYNIYQVWQSPFAAGSLEILIQSAIQATEKMISAS
jgi:hypothetical protein